MKAFHATSLFFLGSVSATSLRVLQNENVTISTDDVNVTLTTALPTEPAGEGANLTDTAFEGTNATDGGFGSGVGEWVSGVANATGDAISGFADGFKNDTGFNNWLDNVTDAMGGSLEGNVTDTALTGDEPGMEGEGSEGSAEVGTEPATGSDAAVRFSSISAIVFCAASIYVSL